MTRKSIGKSIDNSTRKKSRFYCTLAINALKPTSNFKYIDRSTNKSNSLVFRLWGTVEQLNCKGKTGKNQALMYG